MRTKTGVTAPGPASPEHWNARLRPDLSRGSSPPESPRHSDDYRAHGDESMPLVLWAGPAILLVIAASLLGVFGVVLVFGYLAIVLGMARWLSAGGASR